MPPIILYHLSASRSIRTAWLLEELALPYALKSFKREPNGLAPKEFKKECGTLSGKAPVLKDGELILQESGAIAEYLCENYDTTHRLLPADPTQRAKVRQWMHTAEGTFMVHCLPKIYVNRISSPAASKLSSPLAAIVEKDLYWLEAELRACNGRFLVGDTVTAADTMLLFSVQFVFANALAREEFMEEEWGVWKYVKRWLRACESEEGYRRAVEKTEFELEPQIPQ